MSVVSIQICSWFLVNKRSSAGNNRTVEIDYTKKIMPFVHINSLLMTKPWNFDIIFLCNSESYDQQVFLGNKYWVGRKFLFTLGNFSTRKITLVLTGWTPSFLNKGDFSFVLILNFVQFLVLFFDFWKVFNLA